MNYIVNQIYPFEVLPGDARDDVFRLKAEMPDGVAEITLPKLQFQKRAGYIAPSQLSCRVKSFDDNGLPVVTHVVPPYVYELYNARFRRGDIFECEVFYVPAKPAEEPYRIIDRNGIFYNLQYTDNILSKGQIVKCRFVKLTPNYFQFELVDEVAKFTFFSPETIFDAIGTRSLLRRFIMERLIDESTEARREISNQNPLWPVNTARTILARMPEWFLTAKLQQCHRVCEELLDTLRDTLLFLLEGSGYLNAAPAEQQRNYRRQLTTMVESVAPYRRTLEIIAGGCEDQFVNGLLDKLEKSGYLFHPADQFAVLMLFFRLHPEKVGNYMSRIFEGILSRDLDNWKREPFRSAFVEQFEIYVRQARTKIDALPMAESLGQKARIQAVVMALALQILLGDENDNINSNSSLYYRYISLLRPNNTRQLLSKSFLALMGVKVHGNLRFEQLKEPNMMMTSAMVMPYTGELQALTTNHLYTNGMIDISVSSEGVVVSQSRRNDVTESAIPENLMPWLRPQVHVEGVRSLTASKIKKLDEHELWWGDIEHQLFDSNEPVPVLPVDRTMRRAEEDDEVFIVVDSVDDTGDGNPVFHCHIDDSDYSEGSGLLYRSEVVGYSLRQINEFSFRDETGRKLVYRARVKRLNPDGTYIFSLANEVKTYTDAYYQTGEEYSVLIAHEAHDAAQRFVGYTGFTSDGVSIYVPCSQKEHDYHVGDIITVRLLPPTDGTKAFEIIGIDDTKSFTKNTAFDCLMQEIALPDAEEDADEAGSDGLLRDPDEILNTDDVRELIEIFRFNAIASTDLMQAYDYLRFAALLARIIADESLASTLRTHARLLGLHKDYATNARLDPAKLEPLRGPASEDALLGMIFYRLEMVSWLSNPDYTERLYRTVAEPASELEGSIARLVLSYNMLMSGPNEVNKTIADGIRQEIMKKLNVNNEIRTGKHYGSESKYVEFKTSLVFPPVKPGEKMVENPARQQHNILTRIAGLLNAEGGHLYLGVNNEGYEAGMPDDFRYYERHTVSDGRYMHKIKDVPSLCLFINHLVTYNFGDTIARKINIVQDPEAQKGVVDIQIERSLEPVRIDNELWVRQTGEVTRLISDEKSIREFEEERKELRLREQIALHAKTEEAEDDDAVMESDGDVMNDDSAPVPVTEELPQPVAVEEPRPDSQVLATSLWRPNVYRSYEPEFVEPYGFLYFFKDNKLLFSTSDLYIYPGADDCVQTLVIPHGLENGYLVIGYDNERALRIPLAEIYQKVKTTKTVCFNADYEVRYVSLASKDDALIVMGADSADTLWRRAVKISSIDANHLMSKPVRLHESPINRTFGFEIADASALSHFKDCMADRLPARRFGETMRVKSTSSDLAYKLQLLVKDCIPQVN